MIANSRLTKGDVAAVRKIVDRVNAGDWPCEGARFRCVVARLDAVARYRVTRRRHPERRAYLRRLIMQAISFDDVLDRLVHVVVDHAADDPDTALPF